MDGTAATHIPAFELPASTGHDLSLESFLGKVPLAIVFVTGLDVDRDLLTALNESFPEFGEMHSQLLAVAPATAEDLHRFVDDTDLVVPILADASGQMARDYGAVDDSGNRRRLAVVAAAEGRRVTQFEDVSESDLAERLLTELQDLHLGGDVEATDEE